MTSSDISFGPITDSDLPVLHDWLSRPHVAEWWGAPTTLSEVAAEFGAAINGIGPVQCYFAFADGARIGFIQSYVAVGCHRDGWWLSEHDPGVRGIDQFLADGERLGQGIGTAMVSAFVAKLFANTDVTRVQTDPVPSNGRAIRCYEKAGFRAVQEVDTPDGRALLMYADRPASDHWQG